MAASSYTERLKRVYMTAARVQLDHRLYGTDPVSIQIHLGKDVVEALKADLVAPSKPKLGDIAGFEVIRDRLWGFPVIQSDERLGGDRVSVHVVHNVF